MTGAEKTDSMITSASKYNHNGIYMRYRQNMNAVAQLRQLEQMYDASLLQGYGDNQEVNIDELMHDLQSMKKDGPKRH